MNIYVKSLKRDTNSGMVISINWVAIKGNEITKGEQFLNPNSASDPSFVKYKDIEDQTAKYWLLDALSEDGVKNIENYLDSVITQRENEPVLLGVPWDVSISQTVKENPPKQISRRTHFQHS